MNRFVVFLANAVCTTLLALLDAVLAWLLLDGTFHLGFTVWFCIAIVGMQIAKSADISQDIYKQLTRRR